MNNKYLPKVEAKDEQKIFLHNALHIRSPHNNRILKFSLLNLSGIFMLLLITGIVFFTKPYEFEAISKNEAYLKYYLKKIDWLKKKIGSF